MIKISFTKRNIFFVLVSMASIAHAEIAAPGEAAWPEIFETASSKVIQVFASGNTFDWFQPFKQGSEHSSRGTGFIATEQGDIYTNFHVIAYSDVLRIQHPDTGKEQFEVEFVGGSSEYDWAHLRIKPEELVRLKGMLPSGKIDYFDLGDSDILTQGIDVMLLGYPLGEENLKHSIGTISGQQQTFFGNCLTTNAPSYPGNSGGPCIDQAGKIVGILVGGPEGTEAISFLIPINRLKVILDELNDGKIIGEAFWGLQCACTTPVTFQYLGSPSDAGAYVAHVDKGSLAEQAGIIKGDIITTINGLKIDRFFYASVPWTKYKVHYEDILARVKNGTQVIFEVYRGGQLLACYVEKNSKSPLKIRRYNLPFEQEPAFDVFGMVIMELTINHFDLTLEVIRRLLKQGIYFDATKFLESNNRHESRLIITHTFPETDLAKNKVFNLFNYLVSTVNGTKVYTIQDFQQAVRDGADTGYMVIETESGTKVALPLKDILAQEPKLAKKYRYNLSPLVADLAYLK